MRWTLKELLKQCRLALKKNTSKRDKWVKEWAGQVNRSCCKYVDYRFVDAFTCKNSKIKETQCLIVFKSQGRQLNLVIPLPPMNVKEMFRTLIMRFLLNLSQLTITSSQMQWTSDCTKALASTKERGDKKALKSLKKKQVRIPYCYFEFLYCVFRTSNCLFVFTFILLFFFFVITSVFITQSKYNAIEENMPLFQ